MLPQWRKRRSWTPLWSAPGRPEPLRPSPWLEGGLQVALIEKGAQPGSKNVMGGILYTHNLERVVGEDWRTAALERPIIEEQRWMMTDEAAIRLVGYKNLRNREHPHSYSVLRAKFDAWLA